MGSSRSPRVNCNLAVQASTPRILRGRRTPAHERGQDGHDEAGGTGNAVGELATGRHGWDRREGTMRRSSIPPWPPLEEGGPSTPPKGHWLELPILQPADVDSFRA